jgi:aspartyl protease family protein
MIVLLIFLCAILSDPPAELPADAVATLTEAGFRVTSDRATHSDEAALARQLRDVGKQKRELLDLRRAIDELERNQFQTRQAILGLRQQQLRLNLQLANIAPQDITGNNRIVAGLRALDQQMALMAEQMRLAAAQREDARTALISSEDKYLEAIAEAQKLADAIRSAYQSLSEDEARKSAVLSIWEATERRFSAAPTVGLKRQFENLRKLSEALVAEKVQGRSSGNTLVVPVKLADADAPVEMVVDSGASLVSLPAPIAQAAGVEIPPDAEEIVLSLADGRRIPARLVRLSRVRVGPFEANDVEAVVLSPEVSDAPPLLGMSFLGRYNFRINAAEKTLSLVDVVVEPSK